MADNKRDIAAIERLLKKHGDVNLSEALQKAKNPRGGAPLVWHNRRLSDLWLEVESAIDGGAMKIRQVCEKIAKREKLSVKFIEKKYREARRGLKAFEPYRKEILRGYRSRVHQDS